VAARQAGYAPKQSPIAVTAPIATRMTRAETSTSQDVTRETTAATPSPSRRPSAPPAKASSSACFDLAGGLIAAYQISLDPDDAGLIRSPSFVAVPKGAIIQDGLFGDILFLAAEQGGSLDVNAPGFFADVATFVSIPTD